MPFQLKSGSDTLAFDIDGSVSAGGAKVGQWTVTPDNKIKVTKTAGGDVAIGVDWHVNDKNQLELRQSGRGRLQLSRPPDGTADVFAGPRSAPRQTGS